MLFGGATATVLCANGDSMVAKVVDGWAPKDLARGRINGSTCRTGHKGERDRIVIRVDRVGVVTVRLAGKGLDVRNRRDSRCLIQATEEDEVIGELDSLGIEERQRTLPGQFAGIEGAAWRRSRRVERSKSRRVEKRPTGKRAGLR